MKKSLLSVFTMVAMAAAFTACSNDDIEVPDVKNGEARSVFMKLELPTLTRSTEPPVASGTVATVSNLHVYFHDGTSILKYVNATTTTPITNCESDYRYPNNGCTRGGYHCNGMW